MCHCHPCHRYHRQLRHNKGLELYDAFVFLCYDSCSIASCRSICSLPHIAIMNHWTTMLFSGMLTATDSRTQPTLYTCYCWLLYKTLNADYNSVFPVFAAIDLCTETLPNTVHPIDCHTSPNDVTVFWYDYCLLPQLTIDYWKPLMILFSDTLNAIDCFEYAVHLHTATPKRFPFAYALKFDCHRSLLVHPATKPFSDHTYIDFHWVSDTLTIRRTQIYLLP